MPDTLSPQVPIIEAVLDAVGIARVGVAGYEADDVIGTLTARADGPRRHRHRRPGPVPAGRRRARGARPLPAQGRGHAAADRRGLAAREVRGGRQGVRGSGAAARRSERRAAGRARYRREDGREAAGRVRRPGRDHGGGRRPEGEADAVAAQAARRVTAVRRGRARRSSWWPATCRCRTSTPRCRAPLAIRRRSTRSPPAGDSGVRWGDCSRHSDTETPAHRP